MYIQVVSPQQDPLHPTGRATHTTFMHDGMPLLLADMANIQKVEKYFFYSGNDQFRKFLFPYPNEMKR